MSRFRDMFVANGIYEDDVVEIEFDKGALIPFNKMRGKVRSITATSLYLVGERVGEIRLWLQDSLMHFVTSVRVISRGDYQIPLDFSSHVEKKEDDGMCNCTPRPHVRNGIYCRGN